MTIHYLVHTIHVKLPSVYRPGVLIAFSSPLNGFDHETMLWCSAKTEFERLKTPENNK